MEVKNGFIIFLKVMGMLVLCLLLLFFLWMCGFFNYDNVTPFTSTYDGNEYKVRKIGNDLNKQQAADFLAQLNQKINVLVDYMYENKLPDEQIANRLRKRWLSIELKETNSSDKSAAFTLNKDTEIRICIRNKRGEFEDMNTSMFVMLHELAHVMSISYNHTEEFKENFSYITHLASNLGLYIPEDFSVSPRTYCGVFINTTPCEFGSCTYNPN